MKLPRIARQALVAAAVAAVGFALVSANFAVQLTGPARRPFGDEAARYFSDYEPVQFPARDGISLSGWFVPCAGAKCAVVLLHGFGSTRSAMLARAKLLHDHGYAALLYDARAHGLSMGSQVSYGWYETRDLLGALDWLRGRDFAEFGCIGTSQGGATIALAAPDIRGVRWVVLESVYPTLRNAVDRRFRRTVGLPGWLAGALMIPMAEHRLGVDADQVSPRDFAARLPCPVLVMSGSIDEHTHPEDAREVYDHAREPKSLWIVPGAKHVDLYGYAKADYERHLLDFIESNR